MAQRGIREYDAKQLLRHYLPRYGYPFNGRAVLVSEKNPLARAARRRPWLKKERLAAKIDQLVGKRGKNGLVLLDASYPEVEAFIRRHLGKTVAIGRARGVATHFLVEPFVPHKQEYFFAITTERDADVLHFSARGGVDVEEAWDSVRTLRVPVLEEKAPGIERLLADAPARERGEIARFVRACHAFFRDAGFAYLEMNPITLAGGRVLPLGVVARLDDTASYEAGSVCPAAPFPAPFGKEALAEERFVRALDEQSGASLKLRVLNPRGKVWMLVAGGGASVIYADTVADLGFGRELANYGEYSGDPSEDLTYAYANTVLRLMLRHKAVKGKVLLIGGGIANFTDVAATFAGIIRALRENGREMKRQGVRVFVRRGGPNYEEGLRRMQQACEEIGVPVTVHGPEALMTCIVREALEETQKSAFPAGGRARASKGPAPAQAGGAAHRSGKKP